MVRVRDNQGAVSERVRCERLVQGHNPRMPDIRPRFDGTERRLVVQTIICTLSGNRIQWAWERHTLNSAEAIRSAVEGVDRAVHGGVPVAKLAPFCGTSNVLKRDERVVPLHLFWEIQT
jgi:hypothetical protein